MRKAGEIPEAAQARRFGDYLLAQGIENRVEDTAGGAAVWILDDADLAAAQAALAEFLLDPANPKYEKHREAEATRRGAAREQELAHKRFVDVRARLARRGRPMVTVAIISLCVGLFTLFSFGPGPGAMRLYNKLLFASGHGRLLVDLEDGQLWRLVTPVLLHAGLIHLGFNMLWVYNLGRQIEVMRGRRVYAALVLGVAVVSSLTQYVWEGPYFVGMSGVVYGLFGYVWMQARFMQAPDLWIDKNNTVLMLGWLVACMTGLLGPVANAAHVGGLIAGGIAGSGPFLKRRLLASRRQR